MEKPVKLLTEITPGSPVEANSRALLGLHSLTIDCSVLRMRECSLTMNDGTTIEARYPNKEALRDALEELMRLLETEV